MEFAIGLILGGLFVFIGVVLGVSIERESNKKNAHVFNQYITSPDGVNSAEVYRQTKQLLDSDDDTPQSARRMD